MSVRALRSVKKGQHSKGFYYPHNRSEPVHDDQPQGSLERIAICEPAAKPFHTTPILRPSVFACGC